MDSWHIGTPCSIKISIISGNSHPEFAHKVASLLGTTPEASILERRPNGESSLTILQSVREHDVYVVQTAISNDAGSINDHLMELCILVNTCRTSSARRVTAVVPCYPYARQDRKDKSRTPITAKLVANMLAVAGAQHVITMDLHASQIQGFFDIPVDNLFAEPLFIEYIRKTIPNYENAVVVSPDAGGVKRCTSLADKLQLDFAIIHKERNRMNEVCKMVLVGNVQDRMAFIVDDMADTCGTLCAAAKALKGHGASSIIAFIVHPIFSQNAISRIDDSPIDRVVVMNTIPLSSECQKCEKIKVLDCTGLFAEAIRRTHNGESISYLFTHSPYVDYVSLPKKP